MASLNSLFPEVACPVIGMIHLPALPGAPRFDAAAPAARDVALRDAAALVEGGVDRLMIENFGDVPFYPDRVPAHVVASMTAVALAVRATTDRPIGINVLRNDGRSALAIAVATTGQFIRVNVLCGARVADQGVLQGIAHDLMRDRAALGGDVAVFADVDVKHSTALGRPRPLEEDVADTLHRGLADAVIVSGGGTGLPTDLDDVRRAVDAAGGAPVLIGSGVNVETAGDMARLASGLIVGTALKHGGSVGQPVDVDRVRELVGKTREASP